MKVFISWSGEKSRKIAEIFRNWLPAVLQVVTPYFSPDDVSKGTRWGAEVSKELNCSKVGILILTRSNLNAPWIMFEAGALSKNIDASRVCPILFGIDESDMQGPLVQFQASKFSKEDIKKVVSTINGSISENPLPSNIVDDVFEVWWPMLEKKVNEVIDDQNINEESCNNEKGDLRTERDILQEILNLSRNSLKEKNIAIAPLTEIQESIKDIKSIIVDEKLRDIYKGEDAAYELTSDNEADKLEEADTQDQELAVIEWLGNRGITVKNYSQNEPSDDVYNELSLFMGERFQNISRIYNLLKRHLSSGYSFTLSMMDSPVDEIRDTTFFCNKLSEYALIESYKYNKYTKKIHVTPLRNGKIINFFSGGWYERYIFLKATSFLKQNNIEFYSLRNPQVLIADSYDFELDILLLIEGVPYWIECKIGDHQSYINKLIEVRKMMSIPPDNSILVVLNISDDLSDNLSKLHEITLANQDSFIYKLNKSLDISDVGYVFDEKKEICANSNNSPLISEEALVAFLNKIGMRPCLPYRIDIINSLIEISYSSSSPLLLSDVKSKIASNTQISKSKIQDVLNALFKARVFLDSAGNPINTFLDNYMKLRFTDSSSLDNECIKVYGEIVLDTFSNYFDDAGNLKKFEHAVSYSPLQKDFIYSLGNSVESHKLAEEI